MSIIQPRVGVSDNTRGFGGWLAQLALFVFVAPLTTLRVLFQIGDGVDETVKARFAIVFQGQTLLYSIVLLVHFALIIAMVRKSRHFRRLFVVNYFSTVITAPLQLLWIELFFVFVPRSEMIGKWVLGVAMATIWLAYVLRSRRVLNTLVD